VLLWGARGLLPAASQVAAQAGLDVPQAEALDFQAHGKRNAAFHALALLLWRHGWFPLDALRDAVAGVSDPPRREGLLGILAAVEADGAVRTAG
jgi:hypothetical protein